MGSIIRPQAVPLNEPFPVQTIFCDGLADSRLVGGHVHFLCYFDIPVVEAEGGIERQVAARIAMRRESVPAAIRMACAAIGQDYVMEKLPSVFRFAA